MAVNMEKGEGSHDALQCELDEAASNMADLKIKPDNETILLEAQFELFKHLVHKAGVATEELLLTDLASDSLEDDLLSLTELSRLIDRVERDDYQGTDEEERKLQGALNLLLAAYAGDPEIAERVRVVIAVEKSFGC